MKNFWDQSILKIGNFTLTPGRILLLAANLLDRLDVVIYNQKNTHKKRYSRNLMNWAVNLRFTSF